MPQKQQELNEKSLKALEYDKILDKLAEKCSCDDSASLAHSLRPYADFAQARSALSETDAAASLELRFGGPSFFGLKNISIPLQRAQKGSMLSMRELLQVSGTLASFRSLARYREASASLDTCLSPLFDAVSPNKFLEDKINSAVISEEEMADTASSELSDIRRQIKRNGQKVREQLDKMVRSPSYQKYLQDPIVTLRDGRFVVPVKAECRSEVPGLIHDTSASGATIFVEPMPVVEANNELKVLQSREEKEIERILRELSAQVGEFAGNIEETYKTAVRLDFVFAKARLSFQINGFAPHLEETGGIVLNNARHPLIDKDKVVPVSITLGEDFDTLVITGPNTGGKTVALKTMGLLTLMALSGLMIPAADNSRVGFFHHVLADIGDEQSIEQSLSTFSAHMTNIISILNSSGPGSLVLLDELGSGTDPVEGAALAIAVLEHLRAGGAIVAATTHYAELKIFALETPRVENACCEFDVATLQPTYRLLVGVPGRSNAFAISERLGLAPDIIGRARQLVSSENSRFEDVVESLEQRRQQMETEKEAAVRLRREAEGLKDEAEHDREEVARLREKELEQARQQARRLLEDSRAQARQFMNELEDLRHRREAAARSELGSLRDQAKMQLNARLRGLETSADPVGEDSRPAYRLPRPLKAGDTVILAGINKKGTVLKPADASGRVLVQAGIIRTSVPVGSLRLTAEKPETARYTVKTSVDKSKIAVKPELDMRGQNVEEGLLELDRFLDDAQLAGLSQVSVIHGKGTGVLRNAVQQHLKTHRAVKSFRLGHYGEGETGVTIVELK